VTALGRRWFDEAAGPIVRPYAVSRGRTRSRGEQFDLMAVVVGGTPSRQDRFWLDSEHLRVLRLCRRPVTVADLTSDMDLPVGVVRVLLEDLKEKGLISVRMPETRSYERDMRILRTVLDELHRL
jgi:hypothetical protein